MRGSPPLHLVLFALGFALLAIPLAHLTFGRPQSPAAEKPAAIASPSTTTSTFIRLRFAHPPNRVSLKHEGTELLPSPNFETRVHLTLPPDGIELLLNVTWPQGTPNTAVTVELEPDGLEPQSQTRWSSEGKLTEALTFQWKP